MTHAPIGSAGDEARTWAALWLSDHDTTLLLDALSVAAAHTNPPCGAAGADACSDPQHRTAHTRAAAWRGLALRLRSITPTDPPVFLRLDDDAARTWLLDATADEFSIDETFNTHDLAIVPRLEELLYRLGHHQHTDVLDVRPPLRSVQIWPTADADGIDGGTIITIDLAVGELPIRLATRHQGFDDFTADMKGDPSVSDNNARERAIERARKLLAQADHPNTSVEERQAFAAKAAEIMLRHDLAEAVVRASATPTASTEAIDLWRFTVTGSGGHGRHRAWGLGDVAEAYGCAVCFMGNDAGSAPRTVNIVGAVSDLGTLRLLLPAVAALAETTAAQATQQHRQRLRADAWYTNAELNRQATLYRRSFLRGFGSGVAAQIRDRRDRVVAELSTPGTAGELVLVDRAARVVAEFAHRYPKLGKASRVRVRSDSGARDGFHAGQAANLGGTALDADTRRHLPEV